MNVKPTSKVSAAGLGGALGILAVWILGSWVDVPKEAAAAIATVTSFASGWLIPEA